MFFKPLFPLCPVCLSFHAHPGLWCNENRDAVSEQTVTKSVILGFFICYVFYISQLHQFRSRQPMVQTFKTNWLEAFYNSSKRAHRRRILSLLINLSIHNSIPLTSTPERKNVWILRDGVGSRQNVQYFWQDFILLLFRLVEKKPKQRLLAPH